MCRRRRIVTSVDIWGEGLDIQAEISDVAGALKDSSGDWQEDDGLGPSMLHQAEALARRLSAIGDTAQSSPEVDDALQLMEVERLSYALDSIEADWYSRLDNG